MSDPVHELTVKRLRLPAKASGAGFRDLADVAAAAFLGGGVADLALAGSKSGWGVRGAGSGMLQAVRTDVGRWFI